MFFLSKSFLGGPRGGVKIRRRRGEKKKDKEEEAEGGTKGEE